MLILSRRPGEAIHIEGGIRVVVLASDSRGVRIGIEAPSHVGIFREEIVDRLADRSRGGADTPGAEEWPGEATQPTRS